MQCREIEELLSEYIDGVLDQQEQIRVAEHLRQCTACSRSLSDLQDTVRLLRSLGEVVPPVNFRKELREKLEKEIMKDASLNKRKNHLRGLVSGYKRYAAIAAAIVGLGVGFYSFNQPQMDRYLESSNKAAQQEIALDSVSQYSTEAMRSSDSAAAEDSVKSETEERTVLKDLGEKAVDSGQAENKGTSDAKFGAAAIQKPMATSAGSSPNTGAVSSTTDSAAPLGFTNDPASAPPGMGEGVAPVKSMQAAGTSEATADTAPEPDKAVGLLAAENGTAGSSSSVSGKEKVEATLNPDTPVSVAADQVNPVQPKNFSDSGTTAAKDAEETSPVRSVTEGKAQEMPSDQKAEIAGEAEEIGKETAEIRATAKIPAGVPKMANETAENDGKVAEVADEISVPLVALGVTAVGAVVGAIIYYLRRRA